MENVGGTEARPAGRPATLHVRGTPPPKRKQTSELASVCAAIERCEAQANALRE